MSQNILILGNGFDLYHKLPTRYSDFMFFASEWETFFSKYDMNRTKPKRTSFIQIPITLSDCGELTQEALEEFGRHSDLLDDELIAFLNRTLKKNCWIRYFQELQNTGLKWVDFETEIQNALYDVEEYSMESIPNNLGHIGVEGLSDRLKRIPCIFGEKANNGYNNVSNKRITRNDADKSELQKNKLKLVEFMVSELEDLIKCLQYYLSDFVSIIKCDYYSEQIKRLGEVDILNFNYTTTYKTIYGGRNLHLHHPVHGGVANGDIVLGVSDDAFQGNYDFIRFQKYFQRIQKRTGSFYRDWIDHEYKKDGIDCQKNVYIMGHSLGLADFGVLKDFFEKECISKVTVFFHSQSAYEELVINLVKALGKEAVIEKIGAKKIEFQKLEDPVAFK